VFIDKKLPRKTSIIPEATYYIRSLPPAQDTTSNTDEVTSSSSTSSVPQRQAWSELEWQAIRKANPNQLQIQSARSRTESWQPLSNEPGADIALAIPPPITPHEALAHIEGLLLFSLQAEPTANINSYKRS